MLVDEVRTNFNQFFFKCNHVSQSFRVDDWLSKLVVDRHKLFGFFNKDLVAFYRQAFHLFGSVQWFRFAVLLSR